MPLFEHKCKKCRRVIEIIYPVNSIIPEKVKCPCGGIAKKILSRGAVLTDGKVKWMDSAVKVLQPSYEKPVQTRSEWKRYLREKHLECVG